MCVRHGDIQKKTGPVSSGTQFFLQGCKDGRRFNEQKQKKRTRKRKRKEKIENQNYAVNSGEEIVGTYGRPGSRLSALVSMRKPRWKYRLSAKGLIHQ